MLIGYLTLLSGLMISAVAIYYSVEGLVAIYPAMVVPIVIMGVVIELGKLSLTVWLKQYWERAPRFLKAYMLPAVIVLMLITSIGVFGFLSKAHSDQSLVSGDVQSKLAIYDEKIKTARENIEADRKQLKQMDEAVDQIMARSTSEGGADKANAVRKSQQKDRQSLAKDIEANQKTISQLNDEAAPIRAENRKVEADVGPIKYIAAFIYGSNPDASVLEKAVTWITVLIVIVLDPLAVVLLLASQYSFAWAKEQKELEENTPDPYVADVGDKPTPEEIHIEEDADIEPAPELEIKEAFEGIKDPKTGEWIQTGPSFKYEAPVNYSFGEEVHEEEYVPVPRSDVTTPEEDEAFAEIAKRQETAKSYYLGLDNTAEPAPLEEAEVEEPAIEPEHSVIHHVNGEYVSVNGQMYHTNALPPEFQKYKVAHTKDSVILTDENGQTTEHKMEEPTYVQNEEQKESGLWQNIIQPITQEEYQQKAKKNDNG